MGKKKTVTVGPKEVKKKVKKTKKKVDSKVITNDVDEMKSTKKSPKITKVKIKTRGKKYRQAKLESSAKKIYSLKEAIALIKKVGFEKFDASIEVNINTTEKNLKGETVLPHGTGVKLNIAVFDNKVEEDIKNNKINFDILIALPKDMTKLIKYAKVLGPKGLMPSPKKGTLTEDPKKAIAKLSSGSIMYKTESKFPLLHQLVGKKSFTDKQLLENIESLISSLGKKYISAMFIKTSMGPSVSIDLATI